MSLQAEVTWAQRGLALTLDLPAGVHAVVGPNGAGKSSLLQVLAGVHRPDAGHVVLGSRTVLDTATGIDVPAHRRRVALLTQRPRLVPHLRVHQDVALGPRARGVARREIPDVVEARLAEVDALNLADRRSRELSGGQAQRVALARVLAAAPEVLLLDEPLAAVDAATRPVLRDLIARACRREGLVTVVVSHDPADVDALLTGPTDTLTDLGRGRG